MASLGSLIIDLVANTGKFETDTGRAARLAERRAKEIERSFSQLGRRIGAAVGAYLSVQTFRNIVDISDEYQRLNGRLRLVTEGSEDLSRVQARLFDVAQRTRTEYTGVADLYIKLAQTGRELGATQDQLIKFTEGVGNALTVSGASAQTASGALLQLSQALAGGTVRAEEFNSINEGAPEILRTVARSIEGMDGSIAKLRKAVLEGKVSSQDFFRAFLLGAEDLRKQAESMPVTVGQAMTRLKNNFNQAISETDMSPLTDAITGLSEKLADPQFQKGLAEFVGAITRLASAVLSLPSGFGRLGDQIGYAVARITGNVSELEVLENKIKDIDNALKGGLDTPVHLTFVSDEKLQQRRAKLVSELEDLRKKLGLDIPKAMEETSKAAEETSKKLIKLTGSNTSNGVSKAAELAARERTKALEAIQKQVQALETEAATMGRGQTALIEYSIAHGELAEVFKTAGPEAEQYKQRLIDLTLQVEAQKVAHEAAEQALQDYKDMMAEGAAVFEATRTPLERYQSEVERLNELLQAGAIDADTYSRAIENAQDALDKAAQSADSFNEQFKDGIFRSLSDGIYTAMREGSERGWEGFRDAALQTIQRILADRLAKELANLIFGPDDEIKGGGGLISSFVGSLFGGGRAYGGPVSAGRLYRINEREPEFFVPRTSGQVVPLSKMPQSGGVRVTQQINVSGRPDTRTAQQLAVESARRLRIQTARLGT